MRRTLSLLVLVVLGASIVTAQSGPSSSSSDDTIKQLLDRLSAAEAKIAQLQSQIGSQSSAPPAAAAAVAPQPAAAEPAATAPAAAAPAATPASDPSAMPMDSSSAGMDHVMEVPGGPALHFRGFFDFDLDKGSVANQLQYPLGVPGTTTFRAGEFDLFMTSQLSDNLSFLSEFVASAGTNNTFGIDLERFQLTYRPSKYFEISGGRFHTDIGYYNTNFHHGNWFSTATGRPFMYYFEDSGGPLPVHEVGITTTGFVPGTGKLNLHWTAEIGNGSTSLGANNFGDGVENFVSDRNRKDVNFAVYSRPEWLPGLQVGGSFLRGDLLTFDTNQKINQNISSAYAVFIDSKWEFMNEAVLMQHTLFNSQKTFNSPMGYTQFAYHVGKYRPYVRWQEVNIANNDPYSGFKGRYEGPSVGLRVDFFDYAAFKLQYNRVFVRDGAAQNGLEAQMAFTF